MNYKVEKLNRFLNRELENTQKEIDYYKNSNYINLNFLKLKVDKLQELIKHWSSLTDDEEIVEGYNINVNHRVNYFLKGLIKDIVSFKSWEFSQNIMAYIDKAIEDKVNKELYNLLTEKYLLFL